MNILQKTFQLFPSGLMNGRTVLQWHSATNFLRSSVDDPRDGNCWRYDRINAHLNDTKGLLDSRSAMDLLADVAQENTQWSVVYHMAQAEVSIAMGRDYTKVQTFKVSDYLNPR